MTTSKKTVEEIDRLVELQIDLATRVGAAFAGVGLRYSNDPILPRVAIPCGDADAHDLLLELAGRVLGVYDRYGLAPDMALLSLKTALGEAMGEAIETSIRKPEST